MSTFPFKFADRSSAGQLEALEQHRQTAIELKASATLRAQAVRHRTTPCHRLLAESFSDGVYNEATMLAKDVIQADATVRFLEQIERIHQYRRAQIDAALSGDCREFAIASLDFALAAAVVAGLTSLIHRVRHQAFLRAVAAVCVAMEEAS